MLSLESRLSAEEVAEALPGRPTDLAGWLLDHVQPDGEVAGVTMYRWGDVLAAGSGGERLGIEWISTGEAARRLGIPRATLSDMHSRAPADLPGAPLAAGRGKDRRHLRWDAARIRNWLDAYLAWEGQRDQRRPDRGGARRARRERRPNGLDQGPVDWDAAAREVGGR